jgi:hypothetical protein
LALHFCTKALPVKSLFYLVHFSNCFKLDSEAFGLCPDHYPPYSLGVRLTSDPCGPR